MEFRCSQVNLKCIPRNSVNNGINDCSDGSDEKIKTFVCFDYEFECFARKLEKQKNYKRCLSYEMIRDGKRDCYQNVDEKVFIENCTNEHLFLCLGQSRCLPNKLKCD